MIYIVTAATRSHSSYPGGLDKRTMGYFLKLEDAIASVKANDMDINEGIYEYAIIESVEPGLFMFTMSNGILWFLFDKETKTYKETTCPKGQECIIGFWH